MKSITAVLATLGIIGMLAFLYYALTYHPGPAMRGTQVPTDPPLMVMVEDGRDYNIMRHTETGCHYIETGGSSGNFTVMVKADGNPFCPVDEKLSASF